MGKREITRQDWETLSSYSVLHADPEKDRLFLNYYVYRKGSGRAYEYALKLLGGEPDQWFLEDPDYWTEYGKVECENDTVLLTKLAYRGRDVAGCFAFCRMTGYSFPPPAIDRFSHRTYSCDRVESMTLDLVEVFCQDMVEQRGPFANEAKEMLNSDKYFVYRDDENSYE